MQRSIYNDPTFLNSSSQQAYICNWEYKYLYKLYEKRHKYGAIYYTVLYTQLEWK